MKAQLTISPTSPTVVTVKFTNTSSNPKFMILDKIHNWDANNFEFNKDVRYKGRDVKHEVYTREDLIRVPSLASLSATCDLRDLYDLPEDVTGIKVRYLAEHLTNGVNGGFEVVESDYVSL
jgi:hypothetical protein